MCCKYCLIRSVQARLYFAVVFFAELIGCKRIPAAIQVACVGGRGQMVVDNGRGGLAIWSAPVSYSPVLNIHGHCCHGLGNNTLMAALVDLTAVVEES